jgi:hypothetical protein
MKDFSLACSFIKYLVGITSSEYEAIISKPMEIVSLKRSFTKTIVKLDASS